MPGTGPEWIRTSAVPVRGAGAAVRLAVNAAHLASAAQSDATRTEPPFRLHGSHRTLNRIARRIRPA
ncbi:hypothetical protein GCM10010524_51010 [Streptomyces mexicanus]